jgi:hypothetical protein
MAAKKRTSDLDAQIGRLYALPLAEFTAERNALATRLKKEGDRDAAERVKGLAKPSASAWAVNVLFRDEKERMDALLAAGERARNALQKALTHGSAETLRDALQEERKLRDDLRRRAIALLAKEGSPPGRAIVDRLTVNLESLALSPAAAEAAERGWLDQDLDPPGFEVLAGLQLAARPERRGLRLVPQPEKEKKPEPSKPQPKNEERERREREEAKKREKIERAEEKVAKAAEEAETLGAEAERAEKAATESERAAEEARRRAEAARESAERARTRADRAAEVLARAEADLEALR